MFSYLMSKLTYLKYFEIFEMATILSSEQFIELKIVLEIEYNTTIGHAISHILSFCSRF